ncbi:uncharacterized protein [Parasteatoda tepidariorum]
MTCTPKDESRMEGSVVWTDEEGREIINARFTKLDNDDLEVTNAYVGDSGTYKCKYRSLATPEGLNKVYERKLLVYELAGHKFISSAVFDVSKQDEKAVIDMLKDLLTYKVCTRDLCAPGVVRTTKCEDKSCEFFISYEALNQVADDQCDEECIRTKMLNGLKQAESVVEKELQTLAQEPERRLKADMKTFNTKHLITCRAGFHLVKAHYKRCFPCMPGYYSEPNTVECSMCDVGYYQESYGKKDCDKCDEGKTTDSKGSKSRDDCIGAEDKKGILGGIRDGILSIFSGR